MKDKIDFESVMVICILIGILSLIGGALYVRHESETTTRTAMTNGYVQVNGQWEKPK